MSNLICSGKHKKSEKHITFDAVGGICEETDRIVQVGDKIGTLPIATKDGYVFKGWLDENNNEITADYIVSKTLTLYVDWEEIPYKVQFVAGLSGATLSFYTKDVHRGDKVGTFPTGSRTYYTLTGWEGNKNSSPLYGQSVNSETVIDQDEIFKCVWTGNKYTIGFYVGSSVVAQKEFTQGQPLGEFPHVPGITYWQTGDYRRVTETSIFDMAWFNGLDKLFFGW